MPLQKGYHLQSGLIEGRFSQYFFASLLFDGNIIPILNLLLGLLAYTLALVLLATRFFEFDNSYTKLSLILIASSSLPYINEITYFQFILFSQLSWPLVITISLLLSKNATQKHSLLNTILSSLLLLFSIGGYPACANMFVTSAVLYLMYKYHQQNNIKLVLKKSIFFLIPLCFSFICLFFIYQYLQNNNLMLKLYNNQGLNFINLLTNIPTILKASILSLFQPQPFFSISFKLITSLVVLFFIVYYITNTKNVISLGFRILLIFALLLALKYSALLTGTNNSNYFTQYDPITYMVRADFYSIPCFIMFILLFFSQATQKITLNTITIVSIIIISLNTISNFTYTKTQILGFKAEALLLDRLSKRLEENKPSTANKLQTIVQAGEISLRQRYYTTNSYEKYGYYTLQIPFIRYWIPQEFYNFYAPTPFVEEGSAVKTNTFPKDMIDFFQTKIETWPSKHSTYSDNFYNIIALTPVGKNTLQNQFNLIQRNF